MRTSVKLILLFLFSFASLLSKADIYFNKKIAGPITNISRINHENQITAVTQGKRQQDREFSVAPNGDIAFSSNRIDPKLAQDTQGVKERLRNLNIFIQSGEKITQISESKGRSFFPKYNYAGTHIAYLYSKEKNITSLKIYNLTTKTTLELVISENIFDFDWSSDDKKIVYSEAKSNTSAIQVIDIENKDIKTLTSSKYKKDLKTEGNQNTNDTLSYLVGAKWSPSNKHIAYVKHPLERSKNKTLHIVDLKTRSTKKISDDKQQVQTPIDWDSKGNTLLYSALVNYKFYYDEKKMDKVYEGAMHIYTSTLDGKTTQHTSGDHFHGRPVFSPGDSKIAFLYAKKLGDQRTYSLKTLNRKTGKESKKHKNVSRDSKLEWINLAK